VGDTVNMASRMESHGVPGCIQVTDRAYRRLRDRYRFQRRGTMAVPSRSLDRCKGGGPIVPANGPRPPLRDPSGRRARDQGRTTRPSF
jgi:hypothetical protein